MGPQQKWGYKVRYVIETEMVFSHQLRPNIRSERRSKEHLRAINSLTYSPIFDQCISGSSDGDLRVWVRRRQLVASFLLNTFNGYYQDLRIMKSVMHFHHSTPVRTVIVSSSTAHGRQVVSGLDNGSMYR